MNCEARKWYYLEGKLVWTDRRERKLIKGSDKNILSTSDTI